MRKISFTISILFPLLVCAQVPKLGNDTLLDIAHWNIEWFGHASNGPTNKTLQYNNVKQVIQNADVDIWAFCEIANPASYQNLISDLNIYNSSIATYALDQKTALIWKKNMFDLISTQHILTGSQFTYDFASRPPLEVVLKTKNLPVVDTFYFYVIHMKAFADSDAYTRRKNASAHLKTTFLDTYRVGKKVIVLGDWNDDLDKSIYNDQETPFKNFLDDTARYFSPTKQLSDAGKRSYIFAAGSMIDHTLISKSMKSFYVNGSAKVLDNMPAFISNFSNNTSDHYPVMSFYNLKRPEAPVDTGNTDTVQPPHPVGLNEHAHPSLSVYPNPANEVIYIDANGLYEIAVYNIAGIRQHVDMTTSPDSYKLNVAALPIGLYYLSISNMESRQNATRLISLTR